MAENIVTNKIVLPEPEPNIIIHVGRSKSSKSISLKIKPNDKNEKNIEIILSFLTRFIAVRIDNIKDNKSTRTWVFSSKLFSSTIAKSSKK